MLDLHIVEKNYTHSPSFYVTCTFPFVVFFLTRSRHYMYEPYTQDILLTKHHTTHLTSTASASTAGMSCALADVGSRIGFVRHDKKTICGPSSSQQPAFRVKPPPRANLSQTSTALPHCPNSLIFYVCRERCPIKPTAACRMATASCPHRAPASFLPSFAARTGIPAPVVNPSPRSTLPPPSPPTALSMSSALPLRPPLLAPPRLAAGFPQMGSGSSPSRQRPPNSYDLFSCLPHPEHRHRRRRGHHRFRPRAFGDFDDCGGGSCPNYAAAGTAAVAVAAALKLARQRQVCPPELFHPGPRLASREDAVSDDAISAADADDGAGHEALDFASFGCHGFGRRDPARVRSMLPQGNLGFAGRVWEATGQRPSGEGSFRLQV